MPYIFAALVVLNIAVMGYFIAKPPSNETATLRQEKAQLQNPINFVNNSSKAPPLIGTKK